MCGIIGYKRQGKYDPNHFKLISCLIHESSIRGIHSFGYSYYDGKDLKTYKSFNVPNSAEELSKLEQALVGSVCLIHHNRYSTSGNWQSEENNMPISEAGVSVIANCVISQKTKEEYEKEFKVSCKTENDTEIFLRKLLENVDPADFISHITGSFAGCYLYNKGIYFLRNNKRPLHYFMYKDALFVVSTIDIIRRAFNLMGEDMPEVHVVDPYELYSL